MNRVLEKSEDLHYMCKCLHNMKKNPKTHINLKCLKTICESCDSYVKVRLMGLSYN